MPGYSVIVFLHAAIGTIALLAFWSAALMKKGSPRHRMVGKVFLLAMAGIVISGVPLVIERLLFRHQPIGALFLAYLLPLTAQACWMAWRAIADKRDWQAMTRRIGWKISLWLPALMGALTVAVGVWKGQPLLIGFGMIGPLTSRGMWRFARRGPQHANWHVVMHYQAMLGAGIATHVTFLGIGMQPVWKWLLAHTAVPEQFVFLFPWFAPLAVAMAAGVWLNRKWARPLRVAAHAAVES